MITPLHRAVSSLSVCDFFHHRPRRLKDEETIYTERVEGYSKSLKDDALREVREAKEAAERARIEEQERAAQAAREEKERQDAERCVLLISCV